MFVQWISKISNNAQQGFSALGKNMLWLGSAQFNGRIIRLISSILLARLLTPEIFGQVAIILTLFELTVTATKRITSAALIRMTPEEFKHHLSSANIVNHIACIMAMLVMIALSFPIAWYYQTTALYWPIVVMSLSYLILPWGMQHATLNLRNNKMRIVGRATLWQTIADGLLTATLALIGLKIWAIILPKVIVVFIWLAIHRHRNQLPAKFNFSQVKQQQVKSLLSFGLPVVGSDMAIMLRQHIDYLLIGYFMGVEALGVYFFAYNISLGVSLGIISSFGTAFYSHICQDENHSLQAKFINSTAAIMAVTVPVIILQTTLAPYYVPFIYGEKWLSTDAINLFTYLCLSGLARPLAEAASQLLLANGLSRQNLHINMLLTLCLAIGISIACQFSIVVVAQVVMIICLILMPILCIYSYQKVFKSTINLHSGASL